MGAVIFKNENFCPLAPKVGLNILYIKNYNWMISSTVKLPYFLCVTKKANIQDRHLNEPFDKPLRHYV